MENKLICQSCGMPMEEDSTFGTNADWSKNEDYCLYCFKNGRYTQNVTMNEMIEHCANYIDDFNEDTGLNLTRDEAVKQMKRYFPKLKRWSDK
jgi:hypothetical protein